MMILSDLVDQEIRNQKTYNAPYRVYYLRWGVLNLSCTIYYLGSFLKMCKPHPQRFWFPWSKVGLRNQSFLKLLRLENCSLPYCFSRWNQEMLSAFLGLNAASQIWHEEFWDCIGMNGFMWLPHRLLKREKLSFRHAGGSFWCLSNRWVITCYQKDSLC